MSEQSIFRQTMVWTGALLGASALWVSILSISSVLVVSKALPDSAPQPSKPATTSPATPAPKPASSDRPFRPGALEEDAPAKRRNG